MLLNYMHHLTVNVILTLILREFFIYIHSRFIANSGIHVKYMPFNLIQIFVDSPFDLTYAMLTALYLLRALLTRSFV